MSFQIEALEPSPSGIKTPWTEALAAHIAEKIGLDEPLNITFNSNGEGIVIAEDADAVWGLRQAIGKQTYAISLLWNDGTEAGFELMTWCREQSDVDLASETNREFKRILGYTESLCDRNLTYFVSPRAVAELFERGDIHDTCRPSGGGATQEITIDNFTHDFGENNKYRAVKRDGTFHRTNGGDKRRLYFASVMP